MAVFTPPYNPSYGSGEDLDFRVLTTGFGDGYAQDVPDGLNNISETHNLQWNNIPDSAADDIIAQLRSFNGVAFSWTTPAGVTKNFKCAKVSRTRPGWKTSTINCVFIEVFGL